MDGTKIIDVIDQQELVEPISTALGSALKVAFDATGAASQPIRNFLHGTWLGHPLHPVLTDIPIGAWSVAAALDTAEIFGVESAAAGADAAVVIGLFGAAASAVTGLADWNVLEEGSKPRKVGTVHAVLNITATLLYAGSLLLRKSRHRGFARVLSAVGYGTVAASAYLGGTLTFEQKIGVNHAPREGFPKGWTAALPVSEVEDSTPKCAKAGDIDLVVARVDGKLRALANKCSHQGGPLCEGKLSGDSIVCPWHQSRFDLKSGAVLDGPATMRQPAFDARVRKGAVEVTVSKNQPAASTSADE